MSTQPFLPFALPEIGEEEIQEVAELPAGAAELEEELGDLMFALVNVVRKQGFDPEKVMRQANQ